MHAHLAKSGSNVYSETGRRCDGGTRPSSPPAATDPGPGPGPASSISSSDPCCTPDEGADPKRMDAKPCEAPATAAALGPDGLALGPPAPRPASFCACCCIAGLGLSSILLGAREGVEEGEGAGCGPGRPPCCACAARTASSGLGVSNLKGAGALPPFAAAAGDAPAAGFAGLKPGGGAIGYLACATDFSAESGLAAELRAGHTAWGINAFC